MAPMTEDLTTKVSAPAGAVESGGRRRARQPPLLGEDDGPSAHSSSRIGGSCPASKSREADGRTLGFWPETAAHESRSSGSFRDDPSRLKDSVLEQEREVIRGMVRAAHLHAPDAALDVRIVDAFHFRVDDPVADVFFPMPSEVLAVRLHLADQDRRGPEVPHPLAQLKEVLPGILESRHDFEHRQRIDHEDLEVEGALQVRRVHLENLEPRAVRLSIEVPADRPEVDEAHLRLDIMRAQAHLLEMAREVVAALLQRDVRAGFPLSEGVLVDHVERDRGLHRPRFTGEEDDLTDGDAAVEFLVEPVDERTDSVPLGHTVVSIGRCVYNRSEAVIRGEQRLRTGEKTKKERGSNRELKYEGGSGIR